jgi:hypothetical protein
MVGDTGFEPVTSTVGAQKERKAEIIRDFPIRLSRIRYLKYRSFSIFFYRFFKILDKLWSQFHHSCKI